MILGLGVIDKMERTKFFGKSTNDGIFFFQIKAKYNVTAAPGLSVYNVYCVHNFYVLN